jgi:hypothetical protein
LTSHDQDHLLPGAKLSYRLNHDKKRVVRAADFDLLMGLPCEDQWVLMEHPLLVVGLGGGG